MLKSIKESRNYIWKITIALYILVFCVCCLVGALCNGTEDCTHNGFWGHFSPMGYPPIGMAIVLIVCRIIEYFVYLPENAKSYDKSWNEEIKMTFRQFQDIYNINPDKWSIKDNTYIIYSYYADYDGNVIEKQTWHSRTIKNAIYFNFIDWFRFVNWLKQKDRREKREEALDKQKKSNEAVAKMLLAVQKDIDKVYEKLAEPDKTDPKPETALEDNLYINNIRYMKVSDWELAFGPPLYFKEAGTLTSNYDYYLLNDGITLFIYDSDNERGCEYKSYIKGTLDDGTKIYYDFVNKCYCQEMQPDTLYQTANLSNYPINYGLYNTISNLNNQTAQLDVYYTGGGGAGGGAYNQLTNIDSRYSIYNDKDKKYLYDEHTGTYTRIT